MQMGAAYEELSRSQLRSAHRLLHRRGRQEVGQFLVEGSQAVAEALRRPELVELVIVHDPEQHRGVLARADAGRVRLASAADVELLSDTVTSQGLFAVCRTLDADLSALAGAALVVICAQVRDPGNAGTVIRCADAFGADAVVLTTGSVELYNPKTVRASVGSIFHLPIVCGVELSAAVDAARAAGLQVLAAAGGGRDLDQMAVSCELAGPTAWIMGNEAWGLPADEVALADQVVGVPMWGQAESLNLSTAAAVCLYATASVQRRSAVHKEEKQ